MADQKNLYIPVHADALPYPLPNIARSLARKGKVKIVAVGSSSTAGEGGIAPYPSRLQDVLRQKYGNPLIDVINQGIGGQEARDEYDRMQDVIDEKPALTIWQVGTNAAWKGYDLDDVANAIEQGLDLLKQKQETMDVILMDLQYAPALLADDKIDATRRMPDHAEGDHRGGDASVPVPGGLRARNRPRLHAARRGNPWQAAGAG